VNGTVYVYCRHSQKQFIHLNLTTPVRKTDFKTISIKMRIDIQEAEKPFSLYTPSQGISSGDFGED
jgi:hypothetical protein